MDSNIYQQPKAQLIDASNSKIEQAEHYILPQRKLWIFSIASLGVFLVAWNYLHWRRIKQTEQSDIWPVPRAIFSVFFIYPLLIEFDGSREQKNIEYKWSVALNVTLYVVFFIVGNLLDRIYGIAEMEVNGVYYGLWLASLIVPVWVISNAQRVANLACDDAQGETNSKWTLGNTLWLGACVVLWALAIVGLFFTEV